MTKLPPSDTGACGEYKGVRRHYRRNENPCPDCAEAGRAYQRNRLGITGIITTQTLIEEIEFLLKCGCGEHDILKAIGNPTPKTLTARLRRAGRQDLTNRVLRMDEIGVWAA
jgi:hypothetical protein